MIIGVVGFIGSGKGTAADALIENYDFNKLSFADAVTDATAAIFGWPRPLLEGDTDESRDFREQRDAFWSDKFGRDVTPRAMLQMMGTEAGRDVFHSDLWIYALEKKLGMYKNVVIPDVRFPNEMKFIREQGGFIVRVQRGPDPDWYETAQIANYVGDDHAKISSSLRAKKRMEEFFQIHYSEWAWVGQIMDYQLDNNGPMSMLKANIDHMIKVFTGPRNPAILAA
jgi:hypothetical protein